MMAYMSADYTQLTKEWRETAKKLKKELQKPLNKAATILYKAVQAEAKKTVKTGTGRNITEQIRKKPLKQRLGYQVYQMAYLAGWIDKGTQYRRTGGRQRRKDLRQAIRLRKLVASLLIASSGKNRGKIPATEFWRRALAAHGSEVINIIQTHDFKWILDEHNRR